MIVICQTVEGGIVGRGKVKINMNTSYVSVPVHFSRKVI